MRRGDVRSALLIALLDGPGHGYELMRALEARSGGRWRPSAGSVYPSLQMLSDEGLVTSTEQDGTRTFSLTDAGRTAAEERCPPRASPGTTSTAASQGDLRPAARACRWPLGWSPSRAPPTWSRRPVAIVTKARKDLYRLLADD